MAFDAVSYCMYYIPFHQLKARLSNKIMLSDGNTQQTDRQTHTHTHTRTHTHTMSTLGLIKT